MQSAFDLDMRRLHAPPGVQHCAAIFVPSGVLVAVGEVMQTPLEMSSVLPSSTSALNSGGGDGDGDVGDGDGKGDGHAGCGDGDGGQDGAGESGDGSSGGAAGAGDGVGGGGDSGGGRGSSGSGGDGGSGDGGGGLASAWYPRTASSETIIVRDGPGSNSVTTVPRRPPHETTSSLPLSVTTSIGPPHR